jgi:hypothetical protein
MLAPASDTKSVGNTVSDPASNGSIFPGCDVKPSAWPGMLPGSLPTAPYEQIAVGSPLPYQDTSLIKANRQQLINLLEMIKGFLAFEAQEISERSDPTIQLPLQTARTDFHVLQAEVEVLNRNPGIQPNMTLSHLNEIASNLAFLQSEVRLIGSAGPIQGPIYEFTKPVEGFVSNSMRGRVNSGNVISGKPSQEKKKPLNRYAPKKYQSPKNKQLKAFKDGGLSLTSDNNEYEKQYRELRNKLDAQQGDIRPPITSSARTPKPKENTPPASKASTVAQSKAEAAKEAAQKAVAGSILSGVVAGNTPAGRSDAASKSVKSGPASFNKSKTSNSSQASLEDLQDFILRINCESVRLSANGTTDPNTNARIVALASVKSDIEDIVKKCQMDPTLEEDIPISKAKLQKALPALGNPGDPLPQLIQSANLPPGLASLLPSSMQNDPKIAKEIGGLINTFMDGISFSVKYTSPREAQAGGGVRSEQFMNSFAEKKRRANSSIETTGFPSLADLDNASNAQFTPMDSGLLITDRYAPLPADAGRGPSRFDWKSRAKEIEAQVKKRGLKPDDFGIMQQKSKISSDFSWRGYARMICTRLQATMDPHMPILCGCPPMDWPGWRNSQ